jgi:molybdopterin/thiamine biosynthesis adenylyltransferase
MPLTSPEIERYRRQIMIEGWDVGGQERLQSATVFIAGAGGLGSPVSIYLAACGVGTLRISDCGEPELSNLNRQILHDESRIGINKAISARQTLNQLNPHVNIIALPEAITDHTISELAGDASLIVDCLDNFETRHVLNRYAVSREIPLIHGAIHGFNGQVSVFHSPRTPCLACIFPPEVPPEIFPVAGFTPGVIGLLQATETIKILLGLGSPLYGTLLMWDGALADFQKIAICKSPACTVCGAQA